MAQKNQRADGEKPDGRTLPGQLGALHLQAGLATRVHHTQPPTGGDTMSKTMSRTVMATKATPTAKGIRLVGSAAP